MGYTVKDYCDAVEALAPFALAESWDNPGLLVGSREQPVERAMVALDATLPVIEEAHKAGAQILVTHHPIIFHKLGSVPAGTPVYEAIRAGLAVLCAHTNLDIAAGGVNDALAERLELENVELLAETGRKPWLKVVTFVPPDAAEAVFQALAAAGGGKQGNYEGAGFFSEGEGRFTPLAGAHPAIGAVGMPERVREQRIEMLVEPDRLDAVIRALRGAHPYEEPACDVFETHGIHKVQGLGRIGDTPGGKAFTPDQFAVWVRERLAVAGLKYVPGNRPITRVAVCGGAGSEYGALAQSLGAQALVTADTRHDQLLEAARTGLTLIDGGHWATEAAVLPVLKKRLEQALPGAEILQSAADADPVRYLAD